MAAPAAFSGRPPKTLSQRVLAMTLSRACSPSVRTALACTVLSTLVLPAAAQDTRRASLATGAGQVSEGGVGTAGVSADGRFVLFDSFASDLVPGDTNNGLEVFVRDLVLGTTERVAIDGSGGQAFNGSGGIALTPDARYALFATSWPLAANDTNVFQDGYVRDRVLGVTELVTLGASGNALALNSGPGAITPDGRFVAFWSDDPNTVPADTNGRADVFVRDRVLGTTELVSWTDTGGLADANCTPRAITPDGRFVVFFTSATNLVPGDTNNRADLYLRDRQLGLTERISVSTTGPQPTLIDVDPACSISVDGRFVAFASNQTNLVAGDTNGRMDVFLRDRQLGTTMRVSVSELGAESNGDSGGPVFTEDGSLLFFSSSASNLASGDVNGTFDVMVRDMASGAVEVASLGASGVQGNGGSNGAGPYISPDGRFFSFTSTATNLVAGDTNGRVDVFVRDRRQSIASFCSADGTAIDHTSACPCGNNGGLGRGCAHSQDANGALLDTTGSPAYDDMVLRSHATPVTSFTLFLQHDAAGDTVFHDGVLCASGALVRLRGRAAVAGEAEFPNSAFAQDATTTLSQRGGVTIGSGARRYYSAWFRNASSTFCPPATANVTNGLIVDW